MANDLTTHFLAALHLSEQNRLVKGVALGVSTLLVVLLVAWTFRDRVKSSTAEQVADVAKRSLADSDVQQQVNSLSQEVVHRLLTDPTVLSTALQFTTRLLAEPSTQAALSSLLAHTLQDPQTLQRAHDFSSQLLQSLTRSEAVQRMAAELVRAAIQQPSNQTQLLQLLTTVINDPRSLDEMKKGRHRGQLSAAALRRCPPHSAPLNAVSPCAAPPSTASTAVQSVASAHSAGMRGGLTAAS